MASILCIYILLDNIYTAKLKNKYNLSRLYFFLFFLSIISLIALGLYCYFTKTNITAYISYALPLGLIFLTELVLVINLILGLVISKLNKNTTITLDSVSETPNFDDEVMMKKKLDELNRKLSMKKIQEQIDDIEKQLDK